jgi:hypothetical protein
MSMKNLYNKLVALGKKLIGMMFVQGLKDGSKVQIMQEVTLVSEDKKPVFVSPGAATMVRSTKTGEVRNAEGVAVPTTVVYFAVSGLNARAPQAYWESLIEKGAVKLL